MNFREEEDLTEIAIEQLIKTFMRMEKYDIPFGVGGTPLPAPLGHFPLTPTILSAMQVAGLRTTTGTDGCLTVSDTSGKWRRRFGSRTPPMLWVWPNIILDYSECSIVCHLLIRTGDSETFPLAASGQLCRAIIAQHLECHKIICEVGQFKEVSEPWDNLGFGSIFPLSQIFEWFMDGRQALKRLASSDLGIFKPNPTLSHFVQKKDTAKLLEGWGGQLEEFISQLSLRVPTPSR